MYKSRKFLTAVYSITGVFVLQLIGTPLDPLTAGSLFTFLTVYVGAQSYVDGKNNSKEGVT